MKNCSTVTDYDNSIDELVNEYNKGLKTISDINLQPYNISNDSDVYLDSSITEYNE